MSDLKSRPQFATYHSTATGTALADMRRVVEIDPSVKAASAAVPRLEAASRDKLEAQKEEMMGKLKDLGNSVLGRFGMSLDNFKAEKDPNTGSYNISFQR